MGIQNAAQLRALTGLGMASCYQLWNGEAGMISLRTLNTLCEKLQAHPALFFEYTPDMESTKERRLAEIVGRKAKRMKKVGK